MSNFVRLYHLCADGHIEEVRSLPQASFTKCPFFIMDFSHYRPDGSCLCNNREHRAYMIENLEYAPDNFTEIPPEDG